VFILLLSAAKKQPLFDQQIEQLSGLSDLCASKENG